LHAEGYVDNKATILVRAGEKLVVKNKRFRKENEGLRVVIFKKKRKRKRGKALNFCNEGEQEAQALFFSLGKFGSAQLSRKRLNFNTSAILMIKSFRLQLSAKKRLSRPQKRNKKRN